MGELWNYKNTTDFLTDYGRLHREIPLEMTIDIVTLAQI